MAQRRADRASSTRCARELSAIKGGKLARTCDGADHHARRQRRDRRRPRASIGSGPTIARSRGRSRRGDRADRELRARRVATRAARCRACATALVAPIDRRRRATSPTRSPPSSAPCVAWGEPTRARPRRSRRGRPRAAARARAREAAARHATRSAFVAGSDGIDGPPPRDRPAPAGAYVDGTTWDAIARAGIDPRARARALRRRHRARRGRRAGRHRADRDQPRRRDDRR